MSNMPRRPRNDESGEPDQVPDEVRFSRWYVCPYVGCNTIDEFDARDKDAHYCGSEKHPAARLKIFFSGRLAP